MRAVDDLRRLKTDRERLQLFALLIENEQPNEAQRRAVRWVKGNKDDSLALTLIHELVSANRHDLAIELARETSVPGDSVFLAIAEVMIERSEMTAAQAILRGWFDKAGEIDAGVAARFIAAAVNAGAPELALAGAQRAGLSKLAADTVKELGRGLDEAGRRVDADALRASLGQSLPDALGPKLSPRERQRGAPGFKISKLDGWRTALWKRLADDNKPVPLAQVRPAKPVKDLKALKQAKRASSYRRRFGQPAAPKQLENGGFSFFGKQN
jgi:hypothetical protein